MIRTLTLALATAALALPASAAETAGGNASAADTSVHARELANQYDAKQAHNILASRGLVNISALDRDDDGRWTRTAMKDGKTIFVAVVLPKPHAEGATN